MPGTLSACYELATLSETRPQASFIGVGSRLVVHYDAMPQIIFYCLFIINCFSSCSQSAAYSWLLKEKTNFYSFVFFPS